MTAKEVKRLSEEYSKAQEAMHTDPDNFALVEAWRDASIEYVNAIVQSSEEMKRMNGMVDQWEKRIRERGLISE